MLRTVLETAAVVVLTAALIGLMYALWHLGAEGACGIDGDAPKIGGLMPVGGCR